jgi:hypothetical protein
VGARDAVSSLLVARCSRWDAAARYPCVVSHLQRSALDKAPCMPCGPNSSRGWHPFPPSPALHSQQARPLAFTV